MPLAAWIIFFNCHRHTQMSEQRKKGTPQYITGTPIIATVLVFLGWWISPMSFTFWLLVVIPFEYFSVVLFGESPAEATEKEPEHCEEEKPYSE